MRNERRKCILAIAEGDNKIIHKHVKMGARWDSFTLEVLPDYV